jgi:hypothetical protein
MDYLVWNSDPLGKWPAAVMKQSTNLQNIPSFFFSDRAFPSRNKITGTLKQRMGFIYSNGPLASTSKSFSQELITVILIQMLKF